MSFNIIITFVFMLFMGPVYKGHEINNFHIYQKVVCYITAYSNVTPKFLTFGLK